MDKETKITIGTVVLNIVVTVGKMLLDLFSTIGG